MSEEVKENIETSGDIYDTPYYNLDLTEEQMGSVLEQPTDSLTSEVQEEAQASETGEEVTQDEQPSEKENEDVFEISGEQYSLKDIENWKTDRENRSEWQKSNTKKSQEISA